MKLKSFLAPLIIGALALGLALSGSGAGVDAGRLAPMPRNLAGGHRLARRLVRDYRPGQQREQARPGLSGQRQV